MYMNRELQQFLTSISILRFPLILMVIYIHIIHEEISPVRLSMDPDDLYHLLYTTISHNFGRTVVPSFFVFSGFLFFMKLKETFSLSTYKVQIQNRWRSLFIPYFFWNIAMVLIILLKNKIFLSIGGQPDDFYTSVQGSSVYDMLWKDPIDYPLWYLRDLLIMALISPFFFVLKKYLKLVGLVLLLIFYLSCIEIPIPGFSAAAIFFFGLGSYITMDPAAFVKFINRFGPFLIIAMLVFLALATYNNGKPLYEFCIRCFTIFGTFSIIYLGNKLQHIDKLRNILIDLSKTVFFVYAIHIIYIINWTKGAFAKISFLNNGYGQIIGYFLMPLVVAGVCLLIYYLMKKLTPKFLNVIIGGR